MSNSTAQRGPRARQNASHHYLVYLFGGDSRPFGLLAYLVTPIEFNAARIVNALNHLSEHVLNLKIY